MATHNLAPVATSDLPETSETDATLLQALADAEAAVAAALADAEAVAGTETEAH